MNTCITVEEINALAEELAERELAVTEWLDAQLRLLSDDSLKCVAENRGAGFVVTEEDGTQHDGAIRERLRGRARSEQNFRRVLVRAKELDCDSYCVYHDCDMKNCPAGTHDQVSDDTCQ